MPEKPSSPELSQQVYEQLRAIARHRLASERTGHTLQPTALVHEAWLKLSNRASLAEADRGQFLVAAAEAMRRILIDHARTKGRVKRGGQVRRLPLDVAQLADEADPVEIVALDDAIRRFEQVDPQAASVVKLRFFAGLSVEETAETLGVSDRTVKRDWQFARAWLFSQLGGEASENARNDPSDPAV
jgi:RNA polymerase sigma factor (TIGR02999 family)